MKKLLLAACISSFALCFSGCFSVDKLPSEDIEVLDKYADTIAILRNEKLLPNSKEKYDAALDELEKLVARKKQQDDKRVLEAYHAGDKSAEEIIKFINSGTREAD